MKGTDTEVSERYQKILLNSSSLLPVFRGQQLFEWTKTSKTSTQCTAPACPAIAAVRVDILVGHGTSWIRVVTSCALARC